MRDRPPEMNDDAGTASEHPSEAGKPSVVAALSAHARHAADCMHKLADGLQGQSADELAASALTWTKQQPLLLVGGGMVLGFLLSQLVRSGGPRSSDLAES